ncbi:MAG: DNA topoisomerase VI subunit B [Candidatus Undinarchaeales archaeon]
MAKEITADTLFKEFREVPLSEFFRKNKQYLGYVGKIKSLTTVFHELVTNSLDACEESGILPNIEVSIKEVGSNHYRVKVRDNGPGIPINHLEKVFGQLLTGTKFHRNIQLRGQQGLGVSGAVLFSQVTTGKPTRIKSGTGSGKVIDAKVKMDIKKNKPEIVEKEILNDTWRGTEVELEFKNVMYTTGRQGPFEYVRWTAAANPHAKIKFKDMDSEIVFDRVIDEVPETPEEIQPHPEGLETHDLLDIAHKTNSRSISSMLKNELSRVSSKRVKEVQEEVGFDLKVSPKRLDWEKAEKLTEAFKEADFMAPPTSGLVPIGEDTVEKALDSLLAPDFVEAITRKPTVYQGGIPFLVEVAVAYGGNAGRETSTNGGGKKVELMRFANRAPLLFDRGACVTSEALKTVDWKRYNLPDLDNAPVTVFINLISTHVPYTSAGKQAIAKEEEILDEMRYALMQIGRKLKSFLAGKRKLKEQKEKKKAFEKYVPETARAISRITGGDEKKIEKGLDAIVRERFSELFKEEEIKKDEEEEQAAYEEIPEPEEE